MLNYNRNNYLQKMKHGRKKFGDFSTQQRMLLKSCIVICALGYCYCRLRFRLDIQFSHNSIVD